MDPNHVEFASDNNKEYGIPIYNEVDAPISSLTSLSTNNFLDEIALLKRGKITRDTPKHTYRRGSAETIVSPNSTAQEGPISMEELNNRGLILGNNRIIYNVPHGVLKGMGSDNRRNASSTTSRKTSSTIDDSSLKMTSLGLLDDAIHSNVTMQEFYVGTPGEQAKMKISNLEDGISYRLSILDDICLLQRTSKNTMLLCWKSR
ncbi:unnamed protein product [Cylicocyclus nassatus]|uniref:Uncharacterized protein n=1 Tax=Cylicocyclus nassatus TaxID=53992 RepID=A0AA36M8Y3_CYLNA|nr:unnamed protein product [Cylicocyclus nassatus]